MKILVLLLVFVLPVWASPDDLVSISLKGTSVNRIPEDITILDSDPLEAIEQLEGLGAQKVKDMYPRVKHRGLFYTFRKPESFHVKTKGNLSEGDVIYTFLLKSKEEKDKIIQNSSLERIGVLDMEIPESPEIFLSKPGFYLVILTKTTYFTCSMHPSIRSDTQKNCPTCSMKLVEMEGCE